MTLKVGGCVFGYVTDNEDEESLEAVQPTYSFGLHVGRYDNVIFCSVGMGTTTP